MPNNPVLDARPKPKLTFNQKYHKATIEKGTALLNPDGSVTTALVGGFTLDNGKTYNLPTFNNDTGKIMSNKEAVQKFLPDIRAGRILGFDSPKLADEAAQREHTLMDTEAETSINSIIKNTIK